MQGAALKAAMEPLLQRPGWSVSRLARETGIERGRIYAWWRGDSRPTRASMERVARALGVDVATLPLHESPETAHTISGDSLLAAAIDRQSAAMEAQAVAFTRLAESIEAAASGVMGRVAGFEELLTGLLVAIGQQPPTAPADERVGHARSGR
jgi:transcriptional regulator with XRE-family HTH domain